ncbi:hypothetical protein BPT24_300 [Tenacibaculum phage pT24]|uniref:Uncharacterized protein n=1 Tax=Tenacibaculum phage pT24 TaxID=1880590 RepID=A0A1B4XX88_9CAUD|nr:hypothetical protein HYP10_gp227 [Tenacibaculum phage pT24]BAV39418.1 hypothetical protein BPT24_300 [Tenacibaculum phage pT24]
MKIKSLKDPKFRQTWGSHSNTSRRALNKKFTMCCGVRNCNYSSRAYRITDSQSKTHNSSYRCPKHGDTLILIGDVMQLPRNRRKRNLLIKKFR